MKKIKFLAQDGIQDIYSAIRILKKKSFYRDQALIHMGYFCGLRAGEIQLLRWGDYNERTRSLYVRRLKNGAPGTIKLLDRYCSILNAWYKHTKYNLPTDPIFISRSGRALDRKSVHYIFGIYSKAAKTPKQHRHFHVLRHSIAVHLLDSGADIADVQHHLGHRNIQNTLKYAQYTSLRQRMFNSIVATSRFIAQ